MIWLPIAVECCPDPQIKIVVLPDSLPGAGVNAAIGIDKGVRATAKIFLNQPLGMFGFKLHIRSNLLHIQMTMGMRGDMHQPASLHFAQFRPSAEGRVSLKHFTAHGFRLPHVQSFFARKAGFIKDEFRWHRQHHAQRILLKKRKNMKIKVGVGIIESQANIEPSWYRFFTRNYHHGFFAEALKMSLQNSRRIAGTQRSVTRPVIHQNQEHFINRWLASASFMYL